MSIVELREYVEAHSEIITYEYDDWIPFKPYAVVWEETQDTRTIDVDYTVVELDMDPPDVVPWFSWVGEFPSVIAEHPATHYAFPCRTVRNDKMARYIQAAIETSLGEKVTTACRWDHQIRDGKMTVEFKNRKVKDYEVFLPCLTGQNLYNLMDLADTWLEDEIQNINTWFYHYSNPCPRCNGTGTAPPIDTTFVKDTLRYIEDSLNKAYRSQGQKRTDAIRDAHRQLDLVRAKLLAMVAD